MAQRHGGTIHQTVDRLGQPEDIAAALCYLSSPLSDFMTGTHSESTAEPRRRFIAGNSQSAHECFNSD